MISEILLLCFGEEPGKEGIRKKLSLMKLTEIAKLQVARQLFLI